MSRIVSGELSVELTDVFEHFVALIEDEHLDVLKAEGLISDKGQNSSWCANDNMWRCCSFKELDLCLNRLSAKNDFGANCFHELGKSGKLSLDLVCKFTRVAEDQSRAWSWFFAQTLQYGEYENSCLSHS